MREETTVNMHPCESTEEEDKEKVGGWSLFWQVPCPSHELFFFWATNLILSWGLLWESLECRILHPPQK